MKRHSTEEFLRKANKHIQRCSISLTIRELQMKATMRYHYLPIRMAKINSSGNTKSWSESGETGPLTAGGKWKTSHAAAG